MRPVTAPVAHAKVLAVCGELRQLGRLRPAPRARRCLQVRQRELLRRMVHVLAPGVAAVLTLHRLADHRRSFDAQADVRVGVDNDRIAIPGHATAVVDDVIDIASESFESGKTPGTDLREGVPTLVTLNVIAMNRPEDADLIALLKAPIKDEDVVQRVIKDLRAHPALELSRQQTLQYARDARTALGPLPINDVTAALYSLCDAIIDRTA